MKKHRYSLFVILILATFITAACSYNASNGNTETGNSGSDVQKAETELPSIPSVQFGPGDDWFRPTNPADIQMASGNVQFFEFSAVW